MTNGKRHRVVLNDGNGGTSVGYIETPAKPRWPVITGAIISTIMLLLAVGGVVFNATKAGVAVEVKDGIRAETTEPDGVVHRQIQLDISAHEMKSERQLNSTLREIQSGIVRIETKQEAIGDRIERLEEQ